MIKRIKTWWKLRRPVNTYESSPDFYTLEQLENAFRMGYNSGKRDGLAIARIQAIKSLKEIVWQQNQK